MRQGDLEAAEVEQAQRAGHGRAGRQGGDDRVAWREPLDHQVGEEHDDHQRGLELRGAEDLDADLEQDAGQQRRGDAGRDPPHQRIEQAAQADRAVSSSAHTTKAPIAYG